MSYGSNSVGRGCIAERCRPVFALSRGVAKVMRTCPLCLSTNPIDAVVCGRCGKFRFPAGLTRPESPSIESDPNTDEYPAYATQLVTRLKQVAADDESSNRTVRSPITLAKASIANTVGGGTDLSHPAISLNVGDPAASVSPSVETPLPYRDPRLIVIRGAAVGTEFLVYEGPNYIGRSADKPVDIDLTGQEMPEQVWSSRQHAVVTLERSIIVIEDLNSLNGTFVNRSRLHPGQQRVLQGDDIVQVGTVQFKVVV